MGLQDQEGGLNRSTSTRKRITCPDHSPELLPNSQLIDLFDDADMLDVEEITKMARNSRNKLLVAKGTEVVKGLKRDDWLIDRSNGNHFILVHPVRCGRVVVPNSRRDLSRNVMKDVLEKAGYTAMEFRVLL